MRRGWNPKSITHDGLDPMTRLLGQVNEDGFVFVEYDQQWKTFFKAERLGYVNDRYQLTSKGREFLSRCEAVNGRG